MFDEAALLAAIAASPDEDVPRLAYADWLDEHDSPERAELIRVQIELPRYVLRVVDGVNYYRVGTWTRVEELELRERELLAVPRFEWFGCPIGMRQGWRVITEGHACHAGWVVGHGRELIGVNFSRGFINTVICSWPSWVAHAGAFLALGTIRTVRLTLPFTLPGSRRYGGATPAVSCEMEGQRVHLDPSELLRFRQAYGGYDEAGVSLALMAKRWDRITFSIVGRA